MNSENKTINNSADRQEDLKHKREMYRLEKRHERRTWVMKTVLGSLFDVQGFILLCFMFIGGVVYTLSQLHESTQVYSCVDADPMVLERMQSECEAAVVGDRPRCHQRVKELMCAPIARDSK